MSVHMLIPMHTIYTTTYIYADAACLCRTYIYADVYVTINGGGLAEDCADDSTRQRIAPLGASTTLACGKSRVSGSQPQVTWLHSVSARRSPATILPT